MSFLEILNLCLSIISVAIATIAIYQTKYQLSLSNKQQLFERRLAKYLEFNTIYSLYTNNAMYLKASDAFYYTNDMIFSWLTNCSDLDEMAQAMFNPLHQPEQKKLLVKYEHLKNTAIEISMIFDGDSAKIAGEFTSLFADLLKAMYQQQVFIFKLKEQEKKNGRPLCHDDYIERCKKMAESINLFDIRDRLETLYDDIARENILNTMSNSLRLTR